MAGILYRRLGRLVWLVLSCLALAAILIAWVRLMAALSVRQFRSTPGPNIAVTTRSDTAVTTRTDTAVTTRPDTAVTTRPDTAVTTRPDTAVTSAQPASRKLENVPYIAQNPGFPTGCEPVSAVMALRFYGEDVTVDRFVDEFLPQSRAFDRRDGVLYGPDPRQVFAGNPRSAASYGCYAPVIERAVTDYLRAAGRDADNRVHNTTGESLEQLCRTGIDRGCPVLVWASIGMKETHPTARWVVPSGECFTWIAGEHCLVLVGYTDTTYVFHDPLAGANVAYDRETVEQRYAALGRQSLVITA